MSASKPAPAMTANRSPFMLATSIARSRPSSPVTTAPSMSFGMPRLDASRFAVPAGTIATVVPVPASVSMQRCAIPSPPHTKKWSAPCSSRRRTCFGALRLFGTSAQSGSRDAVAGERAAKLGEAALDALAGVRDDGDPAHERALPCSGSRDPGGGQGDDQAPDADEEARGHVGRVVHPPVHPRQRDEQRDRDRDEPHDGPRHAASHPRRDEKRDPAVDRDGRRRVPGVEAVAHREVVQAADVRALAIDRERRDAVGRRLDGDGREDERGHPPLAEHDRDEGGDRHERRDGIDVADPGEPEGDVGAKARPVLRQPHVHVLVAVAEAVLGKRVRLERPAGQERRRREQREPNDGDHHVGPHGVPGHARGRSATRRAGARARERRCGVAGGRLGVCVPVRTRSLLLDSHDHARFPGSRRGQTGSCAGDRPDTGLDSGRARRVAVRRRGASHVVGPCPGRRRRGGGPRAHARRAGSSGAGSMRMSSPASR